MAVSQKPVFFCKSTEFEGERHFLLTTCHRALWLLAPLLSIRSLRARFLNLRWTYSSHRAATGSAKEGQVPQYIFAVHVASCHKSVAQHTPQYGDTLSFKRALRSMHDKQWTEFEWPDKHNWLLALLGIQFA